MRPLMVATLAAVIAFDSDRNPIAVRWDSEFGRITSEISRDCGHQCHGHWWRAFWLESSPYRAWRVVCENFTVCSGNHSNSPEQAQCFAYPTLAAAICQVPTAIQSDFECDRIEARIRPHYNRNPPALRSESSRITPANSATVGDCNLGRFRLESGHGMVGESSSVTPRVQTSIGLQFLSLQRHSVVDRCGQQWRVIGWL